MVEEEALPWPSGPVPCGLHRTAGGIVHADAGCSGHAERHSDGAGGTGMLPCERRLKPAGEPMPMAGIGCAALKGSSALPGRCGQGRGKYSAGVVGRTLPMSDIPDGDCRCLTADLRTKGAQLQYRDMPPPGREDLMVNTLTEEGPQQGERDDGLALRFQRDGVVRTVGVLIMCKFANSQRLRS